MTEIWKDMKGYEGLYKVSNMGRVLGMRGKVLKPLRNAKSGYMQICLCAINGIRKRIYIHRAVAETFIPNMDNKPCVDHINTMRGDNRCENLRWVTVRENCKNSITIKKHITACRKNGDKRGKVVMQIYDNKIIGEFASIRKASAMTNIHKHCISLCCAGIRKTAGGYVWKFKISVN